MNRFQNNASIAAFKDTLRMSAIQKRMIRKGKGKQTWKKAKREIIKDVEQPKEQNNNEEAPFQQVRRRNKRRTNQRYERVNK